MPPAGGRRIVVRPNVSRLLASPVACLLAVSVAGSAVYVVRPGDTLSAIAGATGVSPAAIVQANKLRDPNHIVIGQTLEIPGMAGPTLQLASATFPLVTQRRALLPAFSWWASANRLPLDLLLAVTWMESGWQNTKVSPVGAVGIGQLMPGTARFVQDELIGRGPLDPKIPEHNIRLSARYLRFLLDRSGGDVRRAVASYYQGPGSVERIGLLPESVTYVDGVLALRRLFAS
jgi:soluble lytic murein transglycosylase-like protein